MRCQWTKPAIKVVLTCIITIVMIELLQSLALLFIRTGSHNSNGFTSRSVELPTLESVKSQVVYEKEAATSTTSSTPILPTTVVTTSPSKPIPDGDQKKKKSGVIMLGYMRGGTTLLGEFVNQNEDGFYWFEPLRGLFDKFYSRSKMLCRQLFCHMFNPDETIRLPPKNETKAMMATLSNILTCNMSAIDDSIYKHSFMTSPGWMNLNKKMKKYGECRKLKPFRNCLSHLETSCKESSIRAVKVIRYRMDMVRELLDSSTDDIDVKVIHIIRDPRGIYLSRSFHTLLDMELKKTKKPQLPHPNVTKTEEKLKMMQMMCKQIWFNIQESHKIRSAFPDSIYEVRYEQIAADPQGELEQIYKFIGQPLSKELIDVVHKKTHASKNGGAMNTSRKNATATAMRWKSLDDGFQKQVLERGACKHLYQYFRETHPQFM